MSRGSVAQRVRPVILEQSGHTLAAVPLVSAAMAAAVLGDASAPQLRGELLPSLVSGQKIIAVALDSLSNRRR